MRYTPGGSLGSSFIWPVARITVRPVGVFTRTSGQCVRVHHPTMTPRRARSDIFPSFRCPLDFHTEQIAPNGGHDTVMSGGAVPVRFSSGLVAPGEPFRTVRLAKCSAQSQARHQSRADSVFRYSRWAGPRPAARRCRGGSQPCYPRSAPPKPAHHHPNVCKPGIRKRSTLYMYMHIQTCDHNHDDTAFSNMRPHASAYL